MTDTYFIILELKSHNNDDNELLFNEVKNHLDEYEVEYEIIEDINDNNVLLITSDSGSISAGIKMLISCDKFTMNNGVVNIKGNWLNEYD